MARAPPKAIEDCVHYFYACTDWQAPGLTILNHICCAYMQSKIFLKLVGR